MNAVTRLQKIVVQRVFTDDHLPCVTFKYAGRRLTLWWTDHKTIGALQFSADLAARKHLRKLLALIDSSTPKQLNDDTNDDRQTPLGFLEDETPARGRELAKIAHEHRNNARATHDAAVRQVAAAVGGVVVHRSHGRSRA